MPADNELVTTGKLSQGGIFEIIARITKGLNSEQQGLVLQKQGKIFFEQEDWDAAMECLSRSIALFTSVGTFILRAQVYEKLNDWTNAYYDYSFAIRLEPDNGELFGHRGLCLAKLKKYSISIEDLTKCCEVCV